MTSNAVDVSSSNLPAACGPEAHYAQALAQGCWQVQRCAACEHVIFFPRTACLHCGSDQYTWFEPCGDGVVYATTIARRPSEQGGDLNICLIDMQEGFRMMARVEGVEPETVAIGDSVTAYVAVQAQVPMVLFKQKTVGKS